MFLSNIITNMIQTILSSNLRPIEKLFLTIEWFMRELKPYELYGVNLNELEKEAEKLVEDQMPVNMRKTALKQGTEIFQIRGSRRLFSLLTALSYYSYITDEFVYDHNGLKEMLSKISELGFRLSEIQRLNEKWTRVVGDSKELFNKIFLKQSEESD